MAILQTEPLLYLTITLQHNVTYDYNSFVHPSANYHFRVVIKFCRVKILVYYLYHQPEFLGSTIEVVLHSVDFSEQPVYTGLLVEHKVVAVKLQQHPHAASSHLSIYSVICKCKMSEFANGHESILQTYLRLTLGAISKQIV